jgi:hypothetical protein
MFKTGRNNELELVDRKLTEYYMKKISYTVTVIIGMSLLSLSCQNVSEPNPNLNAASSSLNTSNGNNRNPVSDVPHAPQTNLKVGDQAPDFTLTDTNGQQIKLSDFRGKKNVVLAFYVMAFTGG